MSGGGGGRLKYRVAESKRRWRAFKEKVGTFQARWQAGRKETCEKNLQWHSSSKEEGVSRLLGISVKVAQWGSSLPGRSGLM